MEFFDRLTKARTARYLAAVQKLNPPIPTPGSTQDYGKKLYRILETRLPDEVRYLFEHGIIAIGEVGILTPNALVHPLSFTGYAILFYTGFSHFLYRVSRVFSTRMRVYSGEQGSNIQETTTEFEYAATIIADIFHNFMNKGIIGGPTGYSVTKEQIQFASALATDAELFFVAHEIGHVMIWQKRGKKSRAHTPEDEFEADKYALEFVLGLKGQPNVMNDLSKRMVYAGMEFGLRVFAGLEHLEYTFEETHPSADRRIEHLRSEAIDHLGRRGFMNISTIAFTYDQFLEAVERKLARPGTAAKFVLGPTPERLLSGLSVLVEQSAKFMITPERASIELSKIFEGAPESAIQAAAKEAAAMYLKDPLPCNDATNPMLVEQMQRQMFKEIVEKLPEALRKVFTEAY